MRLIRLYINQDLDIKNIFLDKNSHHYLSNVLRVKKIKKLSYSIILAMNIMVMLKILIIKKILRYISSIKFLKKRIEIK